MRATYQDVLGAPAHQVAEIVSGTLYAHPRPAPAHTLARSALETDLGNPFQFGRGGPGGWWILDEPELHLDDDILVPDAATPGARAVCSRVSTAPSTWSATSDSPVTRSRVRRRPASVRSCRVPNPSNIVHNIALASTFRLRRTAPLCCARRSIYTCGNNVVNVCRIPIHWRRAMADREAEVRCVCRFAGGSGVAGGHVRDSGCGQYVVGGKLVDGSGGCRRHDHSVETGAAAIFSPNGTVVSWS